MEYFIEITDSIKIRSEDGSILFYGTSSGTIASTLTFYNNDNERVFEIRRSNYGFKRNAEIYFQNFSEKELVVVRNTIFKAELKFDEHIIGYSVHYFKKRRIKFLLNGNVVGFAKHTSVFQSGGRIAYGALIEIDDEKVCELLLIFFVGTYIQFWV